ncbi:hypothetical protein HGM15179_013870 [Zosterops borbonicus]|uniref:Uncharacterized protein n=1 Tax=Zosterops borbonicus TaxID=364589 RepID=A0A8K1G7X2_9PASS|nr:hypothetical protein HGM15179_013870 [Zosterops borbonicus]
MDALSSTPPSEGVSRSQLLFEAQCRVRGRPHPPLGPGQQPRTWGTAMPRPNPIPAVALDTRPALSNCSPASSAGSDSQMPGWVPATLGAAKAKAEPSSAGHDVTWLPDREKEEVSNPASVYMGITKSCIPSPDCSELHVNPKLDP